MPTPETTILDDRAVSEIEAREPYTINTRPGLNIILSAAERDALCATVKHLRAENARVVNGQQDLAGSLERIATSIGMSWCCTAETMQLEARVAELQSQLEQLRTAGVRNAQLVDRIRAWSKCEDSYPLDEHINNTATQLEQLRAENERLTEQMKELTHVNNEYGDRRR